MLGYPNFSLWIPIAFAKIYFLCGPNLLQIISRHPAIRICYYTLNSNSFLIGQEHTVISEISDPDIITADYTIIVSDTQGRGNHVKFARFVLLPISTDLPTSITCKSGGFEKKPRKTLRLGPQT